MGLSEAGSVLSATGSGFSYAGSGPSKDRRIDRQTDGGISDIVQGLQEAGYSQPETVKC